VQATFRQSDCHTCSETLSSVHPLELYPPPRLAPDGTLVGTPPDTCVTDYDPAPTLSTVFRHSSWSSLRHRIYRAFERCHINPARRSRFACCGDSVRVLRSDRDADRYKLAGNYCHDRWCTPCANDRARTIANNVLALAAGHRLRFATLTLAADMSPLVLRLKKLHLSMSRLARTSLWKRSVEAAIACLEIKYNAHSDNWHVHYHLLLQGKFIPQPVLSRTWLNITGDSHVVDIRLAKDRRQVARYLTKYASKPLDPSYMRDDEHLDEAIQALANVHLIQTFGRWRGKALTKPPDDGTWTEVYDLEELLYAVARGSESAIAILRKIHAPGAGDAIQLARYRDLPTAPRPPPPNLASQARLFEPGNIIY
jgi:hypothetical protein